MAARDWLKNQEMPGWKQFALKIPRVFFIDKVFGHGFSFLITHAGMNTLDPLAWSRWFPAYLKQFPLVFSKAYHERWAQGLVRDTEENHWTVANHAGLANDPFNYKDEYMQVSSKMLGNSGGDALKDFRQHRFNQKWNDLSPEDRTSEMAEVIADLCNHESGFIKQGFGKYGNLVSTGAFAPKLEGSRWAWLIGDTARSAATIAKVVAHKEVTPEEWYFAQKDLWKKARIVGFLYGSLVVNQGFLTSSGSKEKINFTDPTKSDFLAFKVDGHTVGLMTPVLGIVRLFANLYKDIRGDRTKFQQLTSRRAATASTLFNYAQGKASPFMQPLLDVGFQSTFDNRPMPFSNDPVPSYLRKEGEEKHTWGEYTATEFAPIPVEEGIKEMWSRQGMDESTQQKLLRSLMVGAVGGLTGARIGEDYSEN
jgi:hypothetical protein